MSTPRQSGNQEESHKSEGPYSIAHEILSSTATPGCAALEVAAKSEAGRQSQNTHGQMRLCYEIQRRICRIHSPQRVPISVITAAVTTATHMRIQNAVAVGSV